MLILSALLLLPLITSTCVQEIVDRGKSGTVNANGVFFTPSSSILALRTESLSSNEGTHLETCHLGIGFGLIGQTRACKHIDRKDPYKTISTTYNAQSDTLHVQA
ncbi:hypothetical protein Moror_5133 [Moniliophthora roreri MCA 2997]|uniref:Secreted protein n=1 Tax=Moniliophthora roreri (strain MCA 2997) TaxID=1381753 RepID=V2WQY3_MONRO|nr:hypothetical protein Moror_5133 [Moniliophthora roreri MCA 2997]